MNDLKTLYHILFAPVQGASHEARLEFFYRGQAGAYDRFRKRLLHGREALFDAVPLVLGGTWVDLGAGTGSSLEFMGNRAAGWGAIELVDISPSLLEVARERISGSGLTNAKTHHEDVVQCTLPDGSVDLVTFSYSLTMMPPWIEALETAWRLLKPGGHIGVVDFYVSRKYPPPGYSQHGFLTRHFWPVWFGADNIFLSPDHLPCLAHRFETLHVQESRGGLPIAPWAPVPYYSFVGRKGNQA